MTEERKKENLSCRCIEAFANNLGYDVETYRNDYGLDLRIIEYTSRILNGKKNYLPTNRELKVQLKATTEKNIRRNKNVLKYDLRVKNFNDMVQHQNWLRPTFLFLVILPENELDWLSYTNDYLTLFRKCYWYKHPEGTALSTKENKNVIEIPEEQYITKETINNLLNLIYN